MSHGHCRIPVEKGSKALRKRHSKRTQLVLRFTMMVTEGTTMNTHCGGIFIIGTLMGSGLRLKVEWTIEGFIMWTLKETMCIMWTSQPTRDVLLLMDTMTWCFKTCASLLLSPAPPSRWSVPLKTPSPKRPPTVQCPPLKRKQGPKPRVHWADEGQGHQGCNEGRQSNENRPPRTKRILLPGTSDRLLQRTLDEELRRLEEHLPGGIDGFASL
uniref:E4 protein n=2 Tax=Kappapapillomavirus 2 TaxID=10623 RepID=Q9ICK7_9PAPI|nr:e4 [Kappapapillomavirus 2]